MTAREKMRRMRRAKACAVLLGLVVALLVAAPAIASAATITVADYSDLVDGDTTNASTLALSPGATGISLREAVMAANGEVVPTTIVLAPGFYQLAGPDALVSLPPHLGAVYGGSLDVSASITIVGAGSTISADRFVPRRDRIFDVASAPTVSPGLRLANITLSQGNVEDTRGGGAIRAGGALGITVLELTDCTLADNSATEAITAPGGALALGNDVALTLTRCTFDGNSAKGVGGAIFISDSGAGSVSASGCTFTNNTSDGTTVTAGQGGAIYANAGSGGATLTGSTLVGNIVTSDGTHGPDQGGALFLGSGWTVHDCRIVGASADEVSIAHGFSGTPNLEYNWWAASGDPSLPAATAKVTGSADATPWIPLTVSSAQTTIPAGGTTTLTSRITTAGHAPPVEGMSVGFGGGTYGTTSPTTASWSAAAAGSTFHAGAAGGPSVVSAVFDGVTSTATVNVTHSPEKFTARDVTFTVGAARTETFTADGWPLPTLSMSGTVPASLAFTYRGSVAETTAAGTLAGTPVVGDGGRYPVTLVAANGVGTDASVAVNVTVLEKPRFVSAAEMTVTAGAYGSFEVSAAGFPVAQLGHLNAPPSGLTLVDHGDGTGAIAGVPDGPGGTFTVVLRADNGIGGPTDQTLTIHVRHAPEKLTSRDVTFTVGAAQTETFTANGYPLPTLGLSGVLPSGLATAYAGSMSATTSALTLSGTPATGTGGIYPLELSAGNGVGGDLNDAFTLTVLQAPSIVATSEATVTAGQPASLSIVASGYPAPALSVTGALPSGLSLTDNGDGTGVLSGTLGKKTGGVYPVTIHAANGVAPAASHDMTITVLQPRPVWSYRQFTWDLQEDFEHNASTTGEAVTVGGAANTTRLPGSVTVPDVTAVSAGGYHTVARKSDGTVVAVGGNADGQCNTSAWTDVTAVSAGVLHTVALRSDGTVVATGSNTLGQCNTSAWTDVTAVSAGRYHTVALKTDGTVVATGSNSQGQCNTSAWTDVIAVSAGAYHTVALKSDGTVVAIGDGLNGQCDTSAWTDVMAVSAGQCHTVALKTNGTVVATGSNSDGQCNTSSWTGVAAVSAGLYHTVALKTDGTVLAVGGNADGQCNTSAWRDGTAVSAGMWHTVALRSDGAVVATGDDYWGQCNTSGLRQTGTLGGSGTSVGLRAVGDSAGFFGWSRLVSECATISPGSAVKFGVRLSGDGLSWSEALGMDGLPIDWTTGSGNYFGRVFGASERSDLSALPKSRFIDIVVRIEAGAGVELQGVSVTYDRDDTTPPTVTDDALGGWLTSDTTVTITATDAMSGVVGLDVVVNGPGAPVAVVATDTATVAVSAEGTTTIEYSAIDDAGNRCATETATVRIDKTAPGLGIIASPSQVSLVASDSVSGLMSVWYRVDGGAPQLYTGAPFSPGPSGKHTVTAWTRDVAGNVAATASEVTVDTEAPVVSDNAPTTWRTADSTVTITAYDVHSSIASIDWVLAGASSGAGSSASSPAAVPVTAEGTTTIEYSAVDTAGNRCATETATVRIDKSTPASTATHTSGWTTGPVSVTLQSGDPFSGVDSIWYRTAPVGAWIRYAGAFQVSTTGTTTVTYWAADVAGNTEAPKTTMVLVDDVAPSVSDDAPTGWRNADVDFALSANDPDSGVATLSYRRIDPDGGVTNAALAASTAPLSVTLDGTTTVEYSATDAVGNRCATETVTVRLDKTAPSTTATYTPGSASTPATVTLTPSDAHSGVASTWYRLGSGSATLYNGPFPLSTSGETLVTFWSVDAVGNAEEPDTMAVWLDSAPPAVSDDAPAGWVTTDVTVTLTATDVDSTVESLRWAVSGATVGSGSVAAGTATVPVTAEGVTVIEYSAIDTVGNRCATETATVRIDKSAPVSDASHVTGWSSTPVTVTLGATDTHSGVASIQYRTAPSGGWMLYEGPFEVSAPGTTTVTYRAVDLLGNTETPKTTNVYVDESAPIATDDASDAWRTTDATVTLSATDTLSGVAGIEWVVTAPDGAASAGSVAEANASIPVAVEGTTTIEYAALDVAGNRCATETATVRIDKTAPAVVVSPDSAEMVDAAHFTLVATDAHSGVARVYWSIDGGPETQGTAVSFARTDAHTLRYRAVDVAGNETAVGTHAFTVRVSATKKTTFSGADRYETAVQVAKASHPDGAQTVLLASGINWPDAMGGAALAGATDAPILLSATDALPAVTRAELIRLAPTKVLILGGTSALSVGVEGAVRSALGPGTSVERLWGADRYSTAVAIATRAVAEQHGGFDGTAYVATGASFADALAAAPLSTAFGRPLYLSGPTGLSSATIAAMKKVGVTDVVVLGGTGAVPAAAEGQLAAAGIANSRVQGATRYATALAVARTGVDDGLVWDHLALSNGTGFADALCGGVMQGHSGSVLLLTPATSLDPGVKSELAAQADFISEIRYLGGLAALSQGVRDDAASVLH